MKRLTAVLLALISAVLLFSGCRGDDRFYITGRALELKNGGFMIITDKNEPIVMNDKTKNGNAFSGLSTGDEIKVQCDMILETYPASTAIYKLKLIEKGDASKISAAALEGLSELGWEWKE